MWLGLVAAVVVLSGMPHRAGPGPDRDPERAAPSLDLQQPAFSGGAGRQEREICGDFLRTAKAWRSARPEPGQLRALSYCREVLAAR